MKKVTQKEVLSLHKKISAVRDYLAALSIKYPHLDQARSEDGWTFSMVIDQCEPQTLGELKATLRDYESSN